MCTANQMLIEMDQPNSNKYCGYICDEIKNKDDPENEKKGEKKQEHDRGMGSILEWYKASTSQTGFL